MHDDQPSIYGVLDSYASEIYEALEECDSQYPSSRQLQQNVDGAEIRVQELGRALTELERLSVLDVYSKGAGAYRYDLTEYDDEVMELVADYFDGDNLNSCEE